jgi:hypothetical protein
MRRPWKVAVAVVLGAALVPSSALAAPSITITNPENGKTYDKNAPVAVAFSCTGATSCTATDGKNQPLANGAMLDTSTVGSSYITVTASDGTSTTQQQAVYSVAEPGSGPGGGGNVPATLNLTLGTPTAFAPFIPGVGKDYTATLTAQLVSTAGDATLTVADPSATQTGHLVNGAFALASPLQVNTDGGAFAPLRSDNGPLTLASWSTPITKRNVTLGFKQPIAANEGLRTGAYAKTLTFTLSTTTP